MYPRQQYLYVPFALRVPTDNTTIAFNDDGKLGFAGASSPTPNSYLSADGSGKLKWVALEAGVLSAKTADNLAPSNGQVLTYNGTKWVAAASGSGTGGGSGNGGTVTSVSGTAPITVTNGSTTPVISVAQASGSASGYLNYGDWNIFNSKQDALGYIPLNKTGDTMSGTLSVPLLTQAGTAAPSVAAAGQGSIYFDSGSNQFKVSQNGSAYAPLVSAASVTRVEAGTGLSGGAITTSGTISLANTGVTAGSYTRANITVDQQGRLTAAASSSAIIDADISPSAAIAQSKISGLVSALTGKEPSITASASSQYWRGDKSWQTLNTSNVPEGSNQYFTVARAVSALSSTAPISYSTTTGNIAISKASSSIDGYLSSSDWNTFNNKQEALGYAPLNKAGDTMSGVLNMNGQPLTAVGNVVLNAAKTLGLGVFDSTSEPVMTAQLNSSGTASPDKGKTWFNSSTNQIKYWDGSSAQALGVSGAGLTSLNGQSGSTQSFQVNSSGSAPAINSGANTHTLSIPNASASGVTGGVISNADYNSFNNKVGVVAGASGINVVNSGGTATVSFATAGSAGTYAKVTTNAQGQVTSGSTLVAADIPGLDATKITSGLLATTNGGTGVNSTATFPTSGVIVTEGAAETLTNKTLASATINGASSIAGSTSINTSGAITSGALTAATIVSQGNVTLQGTGTNASKLVLNDKGTNYLALKSPDTLTSSTTWVLPSADGASGQVLATNGSGTLGWASGLAPTGVAGGDLGGNFPNPTVSNVGGVTAANVAAGANLANAATNANTASTIVKRDGSGNFTAGTITGNLTGNVTGTLTGNASTATSAGSFTGSLVGDVTGTQGATVVGNVGGVTAASVAGGANLANAATSANTAETIVKRDASGNFAAGTVTGNLTGNVTGNLTGNVTGNVTGTAANVTGTVAVANGGTGVTTLAANSVLLGNGASTPLTVAPGTSGNVLMSNGNTWTSSASTTNWATPGAIGATTPSSATFTSLTASGNVGIGTTAPNASLHSYKNFGGTSTASNLMIQTQAVNVDNSLYHALSHFHGATEKFYIQGDGGAFFSGNVGIGTTSPGSILHLNGAHPSITLQPTAGGPQSGIQFVTPTNTAGMSIGRDRNSTGTNDMFFYDQVAGATRMYISSTGNVGIGTTAPEARFHLGNSSLVINPNSYSVGANGEGLLINDQEIVSYDSERVVDFVALGLQNGAAGGSGFRFMTNPANSDSAVERVRITASGNVGIGTTSPGAPLWANGSGTTASTANTAVFSATNIGSNASVIHWGSTGDIYWRSASSSGRVILQDSGGNVGIGTTAPTQRLDLGGGSISMGYEIVTSANCMSSDTSWASCTATCPAGKQVLGGACGTSCCTRTAEYTSVTSTTYTCALYDTNGSQAFNATAICANIK